MALDANTCGTAIFNAITAMTEANKKIPEKVWQTVCAQIFAHIQSNALVTVTVASVTGVSTGGGVSGPGTGTGTIS